jgi:hypothetical protein
MIKLITVDRFNIETKCYTNVQYATRTGKGMTYHNELKKCCTYLQLTYVFANKTYEVRNRENSLYRLGI